MKKNKLQAKEFIYADLQIGQEAHYETKITEELVKEFAGVSGDTNPLHTDPSYAKTTEFKKPIAHGMIGGSLISQLLGMHLPGLYCLYLSQNLLFKKPIFYETDVLVKGKVTQKIDAYKIIRIETVICDKSQNILITGEATVKLLK